MRIGGGWPEIEGPPVQVVAHRKSVMAAIASF